MIIIRNYAQLNVRIATSNKLKTFENYHSLVRCLKLRSTAYDKNYGLRALKKNLHTSKLIMKQSGSRELNLPKIFYIQNPIAWLVNKFDMKLLQKVWDPSFTQQEFLKGSKQAVSLVTQSFASGRTDTLRGLMGGPGRQALQRDLMKPPTCDMVELLALQPHQLKVATPRRLRFLSYKEKKFCDVDVTFIGLKWMSAQRSDGVVYAEMYVRFRRDYTQNSVPEWTIVYFKVIRADVLKSTRKT